MAAFRSPYIASLLRRRRRRLQFLATATDDDLVAQDAQRLAAELSPPHLSLS